MPIIMTGSISFTYHLIPERKKTIWTLLGSNPGRLRGKRPLYPLLLGSRARIKLDTLASLRNVFELSWKDLDEWFYHETKQAAT